MKDFINFSQKWFMLKIGSILIVIVLSILMFAVWSGTAEAQAIQAVDNKLENALLAENWEDVISQIDHNGKLKAFPEVRMIKGHACLAANRNNESLCLFLSVSSEEDLGKWENWTKEYVNKNPKSAIAYYFRGDALARIEKWDEALKEFNQALKFNPKHPMILNAKGLVYAAKGMWDNALIDLTKVTMVNDSFADAYTNLGALAIHQKEGIKGAIEDFNKATEIFPDFAIALYGRGCMKFILGRLEESRKDIENAVKKTDCLNGLIGTNIAMVLKRIGIIEKELKFAKTKIENPGFELERRFSTMEYNRNIGAFGTDLKTVIDIGRKHPEFKPMINNRLSQLAQKDSVLGDHINRGFKAIDRHIEIGKTFGSFFNNIKAKISAAGAAGGIVPGAAGGTAGAVELSIEPNISSDLLNKMNRYQQEIHNYQKALPSGYNPSGFKTGLEEAAWDEGNWPFEPFYGLFYKIEYQKKSQISKGTVKK